MRKDIADENDIFKVFLVGRNFEEVLPKSLLDCHQNLFATCAYGRWTPFSLGKNFRQTGSVPRDECVTIRQDATVIGRIRCKLGRFCLVFIFHRLLGSSNDSLYIASFRIVWGLSRPDAVRVNLFRALLQKYHSPVVGNFFYSGHTSIHETLLTNKAFRLANLDRWLTIKLIFAMFNAFPRTEHSINCTSLMLAPNRKRCEEQKHVMVLTWIQRVSPRVGHGFESRIHPSTWW